MSDFKDDIEKKKKELAEDIQETKTAINNSVKKGLTTTKSVLKKIFGVATVGFVIFLIGYMLYANYTYSTGTRTGYLIKISKKGYVFKTYEGQLNLGGFQNSDQGNIVGNVWDFSLQGDELFQELQNLEGKQVQLHYHEINKAMPWQGDTNYFIYKVVEK